MQKWNPAFFSMRFDVAARRQFLQAEDVLRYASLMQLAKTE